MVVSQQRYARTSRLILGAVALLVTAGAAGAGPDWIERGDAGSTLDTAQAPIRPDDFAVLSTITGSLTGPGADRGGGDFEDLYIIAITDPGTFYITLINADFNPQFFLFNITLANQAYGLLANDDASLLSNLPVLTPMATDATGVVITAPGDYLLAITGFGNQPRSITGHIFNQATPTEISGPDGPGGFNPLRDWTGGGEWGNYNFALEGTDFPRTPAPGAAALLMLGGLSATRRRRPGA